MWVMQFGTTNGTAATGMTLAIVAAVVVGGVNTLGGSGTLAGAALGALFLGFISNALILVGLSQFWLQAIYGVVILHRDQPATSSSGAASSAPTPGAVPDDRHDPIRDRPGPLDAGARPLGDRAPGRPARA